MADETPDQVDQGFGSLGLNTRLLAVLTGLGYEEPTPIQRAAIPPLLEGHDLVGQAATGTGKTAAFALPLIHRLAEIAGRGTSPAAIVLVPTRELANQVAEAVHRYGRDLNIRVLPIYGGQSYDPQIRALKRGVDVVVATPGRCLDHISRGTLKLDGIKAVVLDEADEMLDLGFLDDIESILGGTPPERQVMLFSATMAPRIAAIAKRHLRDPVRINIAREKLATGVAPLVRQTAYVVPRSRKMEALGLLLDLEEPTAAIIFCRTRNEVDMLTETLSARGHRAEALHGGMTQVQRERVLFRLKGGRAELVVATDVAARGLDIDHLSHVINFDVPSAPEAYVHRIGRVGRAGRVGTALTMAEPREHRLLQNIERATKQKINVGKLPTFADLTAKRLEQTRAALHAALVAGELDRYRSVVEGLSEEFDVFSVALAAIKLLHAANEPQNQGQGQNADRGDERPRQSNYDGPRRDQSDRDQRPERSDRDGRPERSGRPDQHRKGPRHRS